MDIFQAEPPTQIFIHNQNQFALLPFVNHPIYQELSEVFIQKLIVNVALLQVISN